MEVIAALLRDAAGRCMTLEHMRSRVATPTR